MSELGEVGLYQNKRENSLEKEISENEIIEFLIRIVRLINNQNQLIFILNCKKDVLLPFSK